MKTNKKTLKRTGCLFAIAAVMAAVGCTGCSESMSGNLNDLKENSVIKSEMVTEYFIVHSYGTTIHAFNGDVILDFPPGSIPTTTKFAITSFPLDHLYLKGYNIMERGITLENITNKNEFALPVTFIMRYDLEEYSLCDPTDESDLHISRFLGDVNAFYSVKSFGECCKNCSCKTLSTCLSECGSYVVVED
jgi:hypothetical protein